MIVIRDTGRHDLVIAVQRHARIAVFFSWEGATPTQQPGPGAAHTRVVSSDEHGGHLPEPVHACERQPDLRVFTAQLAVLVRSAARYSVILVKHAEVLLPERDRRRPTQAGDPSRHLPEMLAPTRDLAVVEQRADVVGVPDQLNHARVADAARRRRRLGGTLLVLALSHRLDALDGTAGRQHN
ncbi:hypothetical protein OV090_41435 [Nannocystis sp. RBIL2]|uniref:hypothetical protein n=1 Tax=Nannocystis sp. RBIL2 TaxID=2996788 RepID=UPI00226DC71C|nr:hypothetical protein [Nannocystis sp. RBIL2]MCY1071279.1 hypothetical protein [Nannocystis sp. RBIL2]